MKFNTLQGFPKVEFWVFWTKNVGLEQCVVHTQVFHFEFQTKMFSLDYLVHRPIPLLCHVHSLDSRFDAGWRYGWFSLLCQS